MLVARRCKCKICGNILTTDIAFKVVKVNTNLYYCSEHEYNTYNEFKLKIKQSKDKLFNTISEIMNFRFVPPVIVNEINKLNSFYSYEVIEQVFKRNEKTIKWNVENKNFNSEFSKIKYIMTIISNNIYSVSIQYEKERKEIESMFSNEPKSEINLIDIEINNSTPRVTNDISEFL